jgi:hypothetical protein
VVKPPSQTRLRGAIEFGGAVGAVVHRQVEQKTGQDAGKLATVLPFALACGQSHQDTEEHPEARRAATTG